jgi:chemotaxis protein methyltransferase CheR
MTLTLSNDEFSFIADLLKQRSGLALTLDKTYLLETRLQPLARLHGIRDVHQLIIQLRNSPDSPLAYQVVESMTTNESMFFRDTKPFDHLTKVILPAMKAAGRTSLRIWSAACSTGQEPYSIAMVLKEEAPKYPGLICEIYATDLAEKVIERSREGLYSQFEVQRGLPITMLMKYFTKQPNNMWAVSDALKGMIRFAPANLLMPFAPHGQFDIIFCRNVLIYFDAPTKSDVMDRLAAILKPPGYLFLGGAENVHGLTTKFKPLDDHRGLFTLT